MGNLISIDRVNKDILTLDSREVAAMVDKRHDHLIRDIDTYLEYLSQNPDLGSDDFFLKSSYSAGTGRRYKCYLVTKKGCEFIAHKLTGQKGAIFTARYINRFHQMKEEQVKPKQINSRFMFQIALRMEQQEKLIADMKPKALFADAWEVSEQSILVGEMAKLLVRNGLGDMGQNRLFKWLRKNGYLHKSGEQYNLPTQRSTGLEIIEVKTRTITNSDGSVRITKTPKITVKGQMYFINKLINKEAE